MERERERERREGAWRKRKGHESEARACVSRGEIRGGGKSGIAEKTDGSGGTLHPYSKRQMTHSGGDTYL